mmetsp:Transcript_48769/g.139330  ORF Transcript_48769/g.139330 Transcript_48769/m.139330 type:complete len:285 (+) Transcript_48769:751-1605(+)
MLDVLYANAVLVEQAACGHVARPRHSVMIKRALTSQCLKRRLAQEIPATPAKSTARLEIGDVLAIRRPLATADNAVRDQLLGILRAEERLDLPGVHVVVVAEDHRPSGAARGSLLHHGPLLARYLIHPVAAVRLEDDAIDLPLLGEVVAPDGGKPALASGARRPRRQLRLELLVVLREAAGEHPVDDPASPAARNAAHDVRSRLLQQAAAVGRPLQQGVLLLRLRRALRRAGAGPLGQRRAPAVAGRGLAQGGGRRPQQEREHCSGQGPCAHGLRARSAAPEPH